jgi:hypothetical protein
VLGDFLAREVRAAHGGPAWHGAALAENLAGLTAEQAAAHPVPGAHSVWEIVLHLAGWTDEVRRRLGGREPSLPDGGDWPSVSDHSEAAWAAALDYLRRTHAALEDAVRAFPAARWSETVGGERDAPLGTGVTYAGMVSGLLQHDGYHGGQIGLLRRALRAG